MKLVTLAIAIVGFATALEFDRECRSLPVVTDFDMRKYAGNWYEIQRYESSIQQNGDCVTLDYSYDFGEAVTTLLKVENRWSYFMDDSEIYRSGYAVMANPDNPSIGQMILTFNDAPNDPISYYILDTDYENYSIVWSCVNLEDGRSNEDAWVLSKTGELKPEVASNVHSAIKKHLDVKELQETYQGKECMAIVDPYFQ